MKKHGYTVYTQPLQSVGGCLAYIDQDQCSAQIGHIQHVHAYVYEQKQVINGTKISKTTQLVMNHCTVLTIT